MTRLACLLRFAGATVLTSLAACAQPGPPPAALLSDATVSVVMAREAGGGRRPRGIAERFSTDGTLYAFVSVVWPADHAAWGAQTFESRWYSGDRLVIRREVTLDVKRSPFNFWSSVFPVNLGPGTARYELHADGRKLAEKSFELVQAGAPVSGGAAASH